MSEAQRKEQMLRSKVLRCRFFFWKTSTWLLTLRIFSVALLEDEIRLPQTEKIIFGGTRTLATLG